MTHDEAARVAFWVEYMEQSYTLTEAIMRHPLQECREGFASIPAAAEAAGADMRFSTTQLAGRFVLGPRALLISALGLAVLDAVLLWIGVRVFDRERILMKWK